MKKTYDSVLSDIGNRPVVGAKIVVFSYPSGTPAFIYSANDPIVGNRIPELLTDSEGYFEFYAEDGRYTMQIWYSGELKKTVSDILIEDPEDASPVNTNLSVQSNADIVSGTIRLAVDIEALGPIQADIAELQGEAVDWGLISEAANSFDDYGPL